MTDHFRAISNLMTMLGAAGVTIVARNARMAANPNAIVGDPDTARMVTEKMAAMTEASLAALTATPAFAAAWQRWWWSRCTAFQQSAVTIADRRLVSDLNTAFNKVMGTMQTPFRQRAVANARRLTR